MVFRCSYISYRRALRKKQMLLRRMPRTNLCAPGSGKLIMILQSRRARFCISSFELRQLCTTFMNTLRPHVAVFKVAQPGY